MKRLISLFAGMLMLLGVGFCKEKSKDGTAESQSFTSHRYIASLSGLNARETPDQKGKKIQTIAHNSKVGVIEEKGKSIKIGDVTGKWTKIGWSGKTGWVFGGYLSEVKLPGKNCDGLDSYLGKTFKKVGKAKFVSSEDAEGPGGPCEECGTTTQKYAGDNSVIAVADHEQMYEGFETSVVFENLSMYSAFVIAKHCGETHDEAMGDDEKQVLEFHPSKIELDAGNIGVSVTKKGGKITIRSFGGV